MQSIFEILMLLISVAKFIMIAHIIMSWLINFQVLNLYQPLVAQIWSCMDPAPTAIYTPIRNFLPDTGGIDLAPLAAFIALIALEIVLRNNYMLFV